MNPSFQRQPLWYKDAVIYEVHVRCFHDSRGDGMGDFRGLIGKLDYLKNLGVTAIWLLPFYPSPLRDDGYDIADYEAVNPAYGNLADFDDFLAGAHARGLYVITELVLNHTSDQHPWFQRARRAPAGSPERDFYVWSDSKERYQDARIIFRDFESSNWSWDSVAEAWYWHRFFSHQPDLNFDNPDVHTAMFRIVDFWLSRGVDGLRLDAVPYLYEREGTSCENLPETHAFLRDLSAYVRKRYDHRMLLAEANQWPDDAAAYFGKGDACDMAYHFPLMPRLYMALEMEDRFPVEDILDQTPGIPDSCQWAIFLRNHDELTLEMVTDEERNYMVRVYAKDRRARINLGIRRRLAPLLGNNRRKIELLNKLLLSLPGTPVLYYGDEIGMGDNFFLGDRNGVRTPMQWTPDRNAGFSLANAQQLYLPIIIDSEYHYEMVNVETQERNPSSLLWWTKRALHVRRSHAALSRGRIRFLDPDNSAMLAFLRESDSDAVLVIANLSRHPQSGSLDLSDFAGCMPLELTGDAPFPRIGKGRYSVMLGAHEAIWLSLTVSGGKKAKPQPVPDIGEIGSLLDFVRGNKQRMESEVLLRHISQATWFSKRAGNLCNIRTLDSFAIGSDNGVCLMLRADFFDGEPLDLALLLGFLEDGKRETVPANALLAQARKGEMEGWICEGQYLPHVQAGIHEFGKSPATITTWVGRVDIQGTAGGTTATPSQGGIQMNDAGGDEIEFSIPGKSHLRWYRLPYEGPSPDLELLRELDLRSPIPLAPKPLFSMQHCLRGEEPRLLVDAQGWVDARGTMEDAAMSDLRRYLDMVSDRSLTETAPQPLLPLRIRFEDLPEPYKTLFGGSWPALATLLGRRLAEMHSALQRGRDNPDFSPEPFTFLHQQSIYQNIRIPLRKLLGRLAKRMDSLPEYLHPMAKEILAGEEELLKSFKGLTGRRFGSVRLRIHGDLGLHRVFLVGEDLVFTGFHGEPWLPASERRFKYSPLRDPAMLLHSFALCAEKVVSPATEGQPDSALSAWARQWAELSGAMVLDAYLTAAQSQDESFLPRDPDEIQVLLRAFRIERASQELKAALGLDLPRVTAALRGLLRMAGD